MASNDQTILDQVLKQKHEELAPTLSSSQFFELFVAEQILKDYDLPYEELQSGIVGEGGDGGIDGFYSFANGEFIHEDLDLSQLKKSVMIELVIIQSKTSAGFGEAAIDKLTAACEDLLNLSKDISLLAAVYNVGLREAVVGFRGAYERLAAKFPNLSIRLVYASRGNEVHPNVQRKADILCQKMRQLFSAAEVNFEFAGAAELLAFARRTPRTSYNLTLAETPISSSGNIGFVCLVRLRDYYTFITAENGHLRKHLFEANVRDYQGATQVNEDIQSSLRASSKTEDFWWLNNGVTIIASKAPHSGKTLTLEEPQIVNGLQTTTEIYNYFREASASDDERNLLVRVIVTADAESRDHIIKATNSQTYIPLASLRATDKIHRDIEEYLKPLGYYYDRRKNYYKNDGKPVDRIVGIPLMAQAVMAILLQKPNTARARPSSLLKDDNDYGRLFDSAHPLVLFRVCIEIVKQVDAFLRNRSDPSAKDRTNIRFYLAMHVAAVVAQSAAPNIKNICDIKIAEIDESTILTSFDSVQKIYVKLGGSDQVAKGSAFVRKVLEDIPSHIARGPRTGASN